MPSGILKLYIYMHICIPALVKAMLTKLLQIWQTQDLIHNIHPLFGSWPTLQHKNAGLGDFLIILEKYAPLSALLWFRERLKGNVRLIYCNLKFNSCFVLILTQ